MGLKITQFGGGWGNKAGDCCLLTYGKKMDRHTLIDLGAPQVKRKYCHLGIQADHTLENVIFTHLHEDHIGNDTQWKEVVERCTNKIFLPSKTTLTKKLEKIIKHPKINHATISFPDDDQDSQELSLNNDDDLKVTIKFIIPDPNKFKFKEAERTESDEDKIENEKSLGCLITVEKDEKKWQMLTLGDMEKDSANDRISSLIEGERELFIKVIKLPHHGSQNNWMPIINKLMKRGEITVISSGFTVGTTGADDYLKKHELLDNRRGAFYFLGNTFDRSEEGSKWTSAKMVSKLGNYFIPRFIQCLEQKGVNFDILDQVQWHFNPMYRSTERGTSELEGR